MLTVRRPSERPDLRPERVVGHYSHPLDADFGGHARVQGSTYAIHSARARFSAFSLRVRCAALSAADLELIRMKWEEERRLTAEREDLLAQLEAALSPELANQVEEIMEQQAKFRKSMEADRASAVAMMLQLRQSSRVTLMAQVWVGPRHCGLHLLFLAGIDALFLALGFGGQHVQRDCRGWSDVDRSVFLPDHTRGSAGRIGGSSSGRCRHEAVVYDRRSVGFGLSRGWHASPTRGTPPCGSWADFG